MSYDCWLETMAESPGKLVVYCAFLQWLMKRSRWFTFSALNFMRVLWIG